MKLTKTFKSVNYIETSGDTYARWSQGSRRTIDAVQLDVTDETGKVVYSNVIRKGGCLIRTLADCKSALNNVYRCVNL